MAMVVECESCRSSFRLNVSLLRESKAIRFRCRKCGGSIMVRNPYNSSYTPPDIPSDKSSDKSSDIPSDIPDPVVSVTVAVPPTGYDISSAVRPEIVPPTFGKIPVPSTPVPRWEDLVPYSPGNNIVVPRMASVPRKPSPGRSIFVAGFAILLLAGGVFYIGTTKDGQNLLGKGFASWGSASPANAASRPVFDVRETKSSARENPFTGNLFVVSGTVMNVGKGTSRGIRMRANLLGDDNQVLMENSAVAGNLIDERTLGYMNRDSIEGYLKMEHREEGEHGDIPPGKSLPFMVVFFHPPEKIGSFTVRAADADESAPPYMSGR